ncbi:Alg9-like mannosyltransferase [Pseudomassariella vexata]|uniref:Mannosyltransferase n=1 Tax=Pseudomassariella vexata TaxID=1141098 RepID=A0A1Y2E5K6_9PEZI|nr:Alg9-like mannosyltransferase [Pseudomassariella vexata]ORY66145.1 Alg9-like mannosyltransferase [Pseudomassariella vexata]
MALLDKFLVLLIPGLVFLHLTVAPYTKVEESFNIQATHDILVYGMPTSDVYERLSRQYDHFDFPGAVPRTFVGAVMLAGISQPFVELFGFQHAQFIVRAVLALFNIACLLVFRSNVEKAFGRSTSRWYVLLQASQFHVFFYASRTLPNMFAFGLTTLAFAQLVGSLTIPRCRFAIGLLTVATAIFRSELAILLVTTTLYLVGLYGLSPYKVIWPFLIAFLFSLAVSIPLDSYFWQKPLWPELWGFYYNAVQGSSSEWGTSPWHYYFKAALPKLINPVNLLLMIPTALVMPGTQHEARKLTLPSLLFVAIYSLQPHKEARFIFYVIPPLTAVAALGADYAFTRRAKSLGYRILTVILVASIPLSFAVSSGMLLVSSLNYPGGEALTALRSVVTTTSTSADFQTVMVHTDVLSCMTGVTLFGQQLHRPTDTRQSDESVSFTFDKTEKSSTLRNPTFWDKFDYALVEDPSKVIGTWEQVGVIESFAGIEILKPGSDVRGDLESGDGKVLGRGKSVRQVRDLARKVTGGWWVGPKMKPQIHILKRTRGGPRKEVRE